MHQFKKNPKTILIIDKINPEIELELKSRVIKYFEGTIVYFCLCQKDNLCLVCKKNKSLSYDLVFLCNYSLSFNLNSPLNICKAEIIFNRKQFDFGTFLKGLEYYSECEIRNGE